MYSSRWRDVFSYGQVKTELRLKAPVRPYVERAVHRRYAPHAERGSLPQYLSESSVIFGLGLASPAVARRYGVGRGGYGGWAI